ncbi:MAG: hypothetical protein ACREYF_22470, partial [Gammaproteobacteria bacterium]
NGQHEVAALFELGDIGLGHVKFLSDLDLRLGARLPQLLQGTVFARDLRRAADDALAARGLYVREHGLEGPLKPAAAAQSGRLPAITGR